MNLTWRFLIVAILLILVAWAMFTWSKLAERRDRSGVAVTVSIVGAWAVAGAFTFALAAAAVEGQDR